jgi:hypothetical protein
MFAFQGERPVLRWGALSLFDEAMQEDDFLLMDDEKGAGNSCRQTGAHLPKAITKAVHQRHCTVLMSSPMVRRSSAGKSFNQSRTGSLPEAEQ